MIKIGITHGDINGVGYEVIIKALNAEGMAEVCVPIIYGSAKVMAYYKKALGADDFSFNQIAHASQAKEGVVNLIDITQGELKVEMGSLSSESGKAALMALEHAVADLKAGTIDALVTAPINKNAIHGDDFPFSGHTEYLQARLSDDGATSEALMILYSESLRVALATTHLPLKDVSSAITKDLIKSKLKALNESLVKDFASTLPRIAVLSLNPHCGDGGVLGTEEETIITPAIKECFDEGIFAFGPFAADGFFGSLAFRKYDAVLAMYHDQGLAPFKLYAADEGVNFTAGLPFVRTSPDHGTGFDIAGKNIANPESMRHAIYEAVDITRRRRRYEKSAAHPLRRQTPERGERTDRRAEKENPQADTNQE